VAARKAFHWWHSVIAVSTVAHSQHTTHERTQINKQIFSEYKVRMQCNSQRALSCSLFSSASQPDTEKKREQHQQIWKNMKRKRELLFVGAPLNLE